MSEYGPAVFVSHSDGGAIPDTEQETLKLLVQRFVTELKVVTPMDDEPSQPIFYDYDGYETNAVSFLLYSDFAFGEAPDFIQEDMNTDAENLGKKIAKKLGAEHPDKYKTVCYIVEA